MRLTIRAKLLGGFGVVLLMMIIMAIVVFNLSGGVEEANREALEKMEEIIFSVEKEVDHLAWANELADVFVLQRQFTGELDYTRCDFGQWYYATRDSAGFQETSSRFRDVFNRIEEPHRLLHESAAALTGVLNTRGAEDGHDEALRIYRDETQVYLNELRGLLDNLEGVLGEERDELVARADAQNAFSRQMLITITGVALLIGVVAALVINQGITVPLGQVVSFLREMAESGGDLTRRIDIKSKDEVGDLGYWFNAFIEKLHDIISRVSGSSDLVSNASEEIASGNQDLSQRTEEQASSLEEVSSTVEEVASSLEGSSANAVEADNLSKETMGTVQHGESVVKEMQGAMTEITQGSQEIAEIIAKVNDISFQTNLLALNAAVEAARAGEQGRGFAVVAAEVRNLAGRSAESAKEIEKLIKDSIERVDRGNRLMGDTEKVLGDIVVNTQKTTDLVGEISASLREQSVAAGDIRTAIEELNQVTQQNASLVEEIASASENMSSEAIDLAEQVGIFKLENGGGKRSSKPKPGGGGGGYTGNKKPAKKALPAKTAAPAADDDFDFDEADFEKF